jgi:hypothetical protein
MSAFKLFPPTIKVELNDGFTDDIDVFGRKYIGLGIKNLLETVSDPLVLCVDGEWGTGKTIFLQMLAGELRNTGFPVIAFDAFENDYIDDPFVAISSRIFDEISGRLPKNTADQFKEKSTKLLKLFGRAALNVGIKVATIGALGAADIEGLAEETANSLAEISDKQVGEAITANKEREKTIGDFKELLSTAHSGNAAERETCLRPLVIIIDEIDRCRPDFALKLIERIKHFFSVPNVQFILGANLRQLENSVGTQYGLGLNARGYLQKFITFTIPLTNAGKIEGFSWGHDSEKYAKQILKHMGFNSQFEHDATIEKSVLRLVKAVNLSFRDVEKLLTKVAIAYSLNEGGRQHIQLQNYVLADLAYIWVNHPNLYSRLQEGVAGLSEVKECLKFSEDRLLPGDSSFEAIEASLWRFFCMTATEAETDYINGGVFSSMKNDPNRMFRFISQSTMETLFSL